MNNLVKSAGAALLALMAVLGACGDSPTTPDTEVEDNGIVLALRDLDVSRPANVTLLLQAQTSEGEPLAGLTINSFEIFEDGAGISQFEAPRAFAPKPGSFVARTFLVLDLSASVFSTLPELKSAAKSFVTSILPAATASGEAEIGIWWFDGAAELHALAPFSGVQGPLLTAIDAIEAGISGDISTNLNGAVIEAIRLAANQARSDGSRNIISSNAVVLFTDGTDRAARRTEAEALAAVQSNKDAVSVYTIGLGGEISQESLTAIGIDGFFAAGGVGDLAGAFGNAGSSIRNEANSFYRFDYCSPKRAGIHTLKIRATQGERSGSITTTFSANDFTGGCTAGVSG